MDLDASAGRRGPARSGVSDHREADRLLREQGGHRRPGSERSRGGAGVRVPVLEKRRRDRRGVRREGPPPRYRGRDLRQGRRGVQLGAHQQHPRQPGRRTRCSRRATATPSTLPPERVSLVRSRRRAWCGQAGCATGRSTSRWWSMRAIGCSSWTPAPQRRQHAPRLHLHDIGQGPGCGNPVCGNGGGGSHRRRAGRVVRRVLGAGGASCV